MAKPLEERKPVHNNENIVYAYATDDNRPFSIELAGETFPDKKYFIPRRPGHPWVFDCVISGKGYIESDGIKHPVEAGDFFIISGYSTLSFYSDSETPFRKVFINCRGSLPRHLCQSFTIDQPFFIYHFPKAEKFIRTIHQILTNANISQAKKDQSCGNVLFCMLSALNEEIQYAKNSAKNPLVHAIKSYIDQNVCEKISLDDICKTFFINKTKLITLFQAAFDISPYQYLVNQRLAMACLLLKSSILSVQEISDKLQFSSPHYFSSFFKSRIGCTPSKYRQDINADHS